MSDNSVTFCVYYSSSDSDYYYHKVQENYNFLKIMLIYWLKIQWSLGSMALAPIHSFLLKHIYIVDVWEAKLEHHDFWVSKILLHSVEKQYFIGTKKLCK